jgi:hypothetical protein
MANEDNLKPVRTESEAREKGTKGGIASGKSRRRKKAMKERLQEALECSVVNPKVKKMMQSVGMKGGRTNYDAVTASIVAGAIQGAPGYARLLMELIGETGEEKRADKADKREAKRLRMQEEEFRRKHMDEDGENDSGDDGFIEALEAAAEDDWANEDI